MRPPWRRSSLGRGEAEMGEGGLKRPLAGASVVTDSESWDGGLLPFIPLADWVLLHRPPVVEQTPVLNISCSVLTLELEVLVTTLFSCWITARPLRTFPVSLFFLEAPTSVFSLLPLCSHSSSLSSSSSSSASLSLAESEEPDRLSSLCRKTSSCCLLVCGGVFSGLEW